MKTFKLKSLDIMKHEADDIVQDEISLLDGLIINREDAENRWLIELYTNQSYLHFFNSLYESGDEIIVQGKITKETNQPATFIASVIEVNEIADNMNVLLIATMVDRQKNKIDEMLTLLINEGYEGEELLRKFKDVT
ncbi:YwpF family protein [Virgibacillus xinjiangensis]|uniref:YwpF family protein n=1 Tax=Virgibacillus xinjiangensis TaxID=393090 RepID=A0ABV7CTX5_9BACI